MRRAYTLPSQPLREQGPRQVDLPSGAVRLCTHLHLLHLPRTFSRSATNAPSAIAVTDRYTTGRDLGGSTGVQVSGDKSTPLGRLWDRVTTHQTLADDARMAFDRAAYADYHAGGRSFRQIADDAGCTPKTVHAAVTREARRRQGDPPPELEGET